jgi:hypothetical protein
MDDARLAFGQAFDRPWAYALALAGAAAMWLLLLWSGEMLKRFPSGWELHFEPWRLLSVSLFSALFGLLLPLEAAALRRARAVSGAAGATAGAVFGLLSVSCCAPFVVPAALSLVGFSGTALLSFNGAVRQISGPLTALALVFLGLSLVLVTRALTSACRLRG